MSDELKPVQCEVVIQNREGLHARPVMRFVDLAQTFSSDIRVSQLRGTRQEVDGKSAMEMMLLGATHGTRLRISAVGSDAASALEALTELVNIQFDIQVSDDA